MAPDDGCDDVLVVLKCIDRHEPAEYQHEDALMISTTDVYSWNFSSILQHRIVKVKAHRNRLIENSSYFHGLLGGNFSDPDVEVLVQWNQSTFLSLLASLFGSPLDVTSENFLSIFEGSLYFGMEMVLSQCKMWLTKALSVTGVPLVQLSDLVSIWEFGSELVDYLRELCTNYHAKNFIWALSCRSFVDVPHDLLLSTMKHPHLTVDSEKQLCDILLAWIAANKERCSEDVCITLLKQIRISLLPLWFAAGKSTYQSLSMCSNESSCGALTLLEQPVTRLMDAQGDSDLRNLKIRLTEFTQRVDLEGCLQITPTILLLSMLPSSYSMEPVLRKKIVQLLINHETLSGNAFKISCEMWSKLTFEAVHEIDISNCPMLHLEDAVECFSKSFPSLRKLKAANHLRLRTSKLLQLLVDRCPLLCDIDLTVDLSPVIITQMSSVASSFDSVSSSLHVLWSKPLPSNITKLTLEGRIDVTDSDLQSISDLCVSLTYISLKGCTSVSDAGISSVICRCLKLDSVVACGTYFGQQSILALCSLNACDDHVTTEHSIPQGSNIQMLHMGGCKESQKIISSGWPGLISIHLEECGQVTSNGVEALFDCHALEDVLLRHSGSGIQKGFIGDAISKLPMLRKLSLDICDAKDRDYDIPELTDRHFLNQVKIARCKSRRCTLNLQHGGESRSSLHRETLVIMWHSKQTIRTLVNERV